MGGAGDCGFPRARRLSRPAEFAQAFERGRRTSDPYFTLIAVANGRGEARLGLAIARKAAGTAVARNRLKRLVRETFRLQRARLPAVDVVVTARPAAVAQPNPVLRASLNRLWERLGR